MRRDALEPTAIIETAPDTSAGALSPFELIVTLPELGAQNYRLKYGDNVVGRSDKCDIQVPDANLVLSRRHVMIKVSRDAIELVDLKGQNGTFVNGNRVDTATIAAGTSFHLGTLKFGLLKK